MKLLSIIGARPQFIKAAVFRKHCSDVGVEEILIHTGQHYDPEMSINIFSDLNVNSPDISLRLNGRSHASMTGEMLTQIEKLILSHSPDYVNVYGDTNSTLAGALAASKLNIPVIHIEAGLRSFNRKMPEETNRVLTDHMSDFLFCPTYTSVENLKRENITSGVHHVGDIMYDAKLEFESLFRLPRNIKLDRYRKLAVMTLHRQETVSNKIDLIKAIEYCRSYSKSHQIIFPAHPNTANKLKEYSIDLRGLEVIQPIGYLEMQGLLAEADLVLTDSGGLQKEAYFHKCNCVTLRNETEWGETVDCGWNRLWVSDSHYKNRQAIKEYGSGNVSKKILELI